MISDIRSPRTVNTSIDQPRCVAASSFQRWLPTAGWPVAALLAADHTVLTTDPRGTGRSQLDDPDQDSTPELRADGLSRLLAHRERRQFRRYPQAHRVHYEG